MGVRVEGFRCRVLGLRVYGAKMLICFWQHVGVYCDWCVCVCVLVLWLSIPVVASCLISVVS